MDLEKIKKRLAELQTSNTKTNNLWKPQPGKTTVRILPYKLNSDLPFVELYFHYDLNGKTYLSPISFGRPDPIEEFATKLKTSGNKEEWKLGKKIEAKMRTFAPVIVRGEESEGVRFWGFGKTVYESLLSIITNPDYGDISDPINGRDIIVEFQTAEELGASFPRTSILPRGIVTPLSENPDVVKKLIESQKDLKEIYQELSYDELSDALEEYLHPSDDEEDAKHSESYTAPQIESEIKTASNVGDAFDELFNSK